MGGLVRQPAELLWPLDFIFCWTVKVLKESPKFSRNLQIFINTAPHYLAVALLVPRWPSTPLPLYNDDINLCDEGEVVAHSSRHSGCLCPAS